MRTSLEIQREIERLKGKVQAVETAISDKQSELDQVRKVHAMLVIESAGGKQPASVQVQRQKIQNHESDIEVLSQGLQDLRDQIPELEQELKAATIQENEIPRLLQEQIQYNEQLSEIKSALVGLFSQGDRLKNAMDALTGVWAPSEELDRVIGALPERYRDELDLTGFDTQPQLELFNRVFPFLRRCDDLGQLAKQAIFRCENISRPLRFTVPNPPAPEPPHPGGKLEKIDGPTGIYRSPQDYSVHDQKRAGLDPIVPPTGPGERRRDRPLPGQYDPSKNLNQAVEV